MSIADDTVDEADETFTLTLTTADNASLPADKTAVGTIEDDDDPLVGTGAASAGEGAGSVVFSVSLGRVARRGCDGGLYGVERVG